MASWARTATASSRAGRRTSPAISSPPSLRWISTGFACGCRAFMPRATTIPTTITEGGFDAIFENPQFAGADTSYFIRQSIPFVGGGGGVFLNGRNGVLMDLRSSKEEGQSNFNNPGTILLGAGADFDVLPELRVSVKPEPSVVRRHHHRGGAAPAGQHLPGYRLGCVHGADLAAAPDARTSYCARRARCWCRARASTNCSPPIRMTESIIPFCSTRSWLSRAVHGCGLV